MEGLAVLNPYTQTNPVSMKNRWFYKKPGFCIHWDVHLALLSVKYSFEYFACVFGVVTVAVPPHGTSQNCSN
jgi:transposase